MKRILPAFINAFIIFSLLASLTKSVFADAVPFPSPDVLYTEDPEVNFVGKTDARAVQFLNWTLQNYEWACYVENPATAVGVRKCDNDKNPLIKFWVTIRNIIYALFALIILITAFVLMATRGKSLTLKRFIPRFIAVVLLVTLSYSLIQIIYITVDIIQGFFLAKPPSVPGGPRELISSIDLLYVGWDYENFRGLRKVHPYFDESVFVNLLLARLTAVTYYAMSGILIIRKIILWFFIVLSPVFPILLLYYPVRNTAKIWIGEFFRWLLYAPLFTIFLSGLVSVWKSPRLPLIFDFSNVGTSLTYPTATNVLLGGPGQVVAMENNLNTPDTFALYVVALIMLWVVILLPFILLQIFLDYLNNFSFEDSPAMQKLINTSYMLINKTPPAPITPIPPPTAAGMAKQFPFAKFGAAKNLPVYDEGPKGAAKQMPIAIPIGTAMQTQIAKPISMAQASVNAEILNATNISLPTIRDIATFERQFISNRESTNVSKTNEALLRLANPTNIQNEIERDRFTKLKERLVKESQTGNNVATSILSAANVVNNIANVSKVSSQNLNQIKNLRKSLTNITNPQSVSSSDKERISQLRDSLIKESEKGNTIASTILAAKENVSVRELQSIKDQLTKESIQGNNISSAVLATSFTKEHESVLKNVLTQIANPETASVFDKERISQLHESLVKESEKGNSLATSILATKETTTSNEIHDMKEKLIDATLQGNQNAASVLSTAISRIDTNSTQKIMQQLANPATISNSATREKFEKVKEKLTQAQSQGNQFAGTMLTKMGEVSKEEADLTKSVNTKEMETIKSKLLEAKEKGEPLANEVLSLFTAEGSLSEGVNIPAANRIQTVSTEDYEAVRKMWQENYKGMDVPAGLESREGWIKSDVADIDNILSLLESNDQEKINQGMQEVGNVLPFLMLGGFSQEEIVSYLKAKREAGKSIIEEITEEADTLVSAKTSTTTKSAMSRAATIDTYDDSTLTDLQSQPALKENINTELLDLTSLPMPTIRDVVRFETSLMSKDASKKEEVIKVRDILNQIANPANITSETEKERIEKIRQILVQNSEQGDQIATSMVNAINHLALLSNVAPISHITTKQVFQQINNPSTITETSRKERLTAMHDRLVAESEKGNQLASSILKLSENSSAEDVQRMKEQVLEVKEKDNQLASDISELLPISEQSAGNVTLPVSNRVQTVSQEDYMAVQKMWEENYKSIDLPADVKNRIDWIKKDVSNMDQISNLLTSQNEENVQQGMKEVGNILPFLLLGGFSKDEIVSYLNAKREAGKSVIQEIESEEDTLIMVNKHTTTQGINSHSMSVSATANDANVQNTVNLTTPQINVNTELLKLTNLPLPSMQDVVKYEISLAAKDPTVSDDAKKIREKLIQIVNPTNETSEQDKSFAENIRQTLIQNSKKGDVLANSIINAVNHTAVAANVSTIQQLTTNQILQQIANPSIIKNENFKAKLSAIHDRLVTEKDSGNEFAKNLLAVNENTTSEDTLKLKDQILSAKERQDPLGLEIFDLLPTENSEQAQELPKVNTIQNVSVEEYEAVRKLWEDSYRNIDLPNGINSREDWIKRDLLNADRVIELLSSEDHARLKQGMQEVGNILPFLLLGGFSRSEIVSYLKAKKAAGTQVLQNINNEKNDEDTMMDKEVSTKSTNIRHEAVRMDLPESESLVTKNPQSDSLNSGSGITIDTRLADETILPKPTLKDLISYEQSFMINESAVKNEVLRIQGILNALEKPDTLSTEAEKARVINLKNDLINKSNSGDTYAKIILSAAKLSTDNLTDAATNPVSIFHQYLLEVIKPENFPSVAGNENIHKVHEELVIEANKKNILADRILMVTDQTPRDQIMDLKDEIKAESGAGNPLAQLVWENAPKDIQKESVEQRSDEIALPDVNPVQTVSINDYETVRLMWEDFYRMTDFNEDKKEWLLKESENIHSILMQLSSNDKERVRDGLTQVSRVLPFILLGGFTLSEITTYLDAKLNAANSILRQITQNGNDEELLNLKSERKTEESNKTEEVPV